MKSIGSQKSDNFELWYCGNSIETSTNVPYFAFSNEFWDLFDTHQIPKEHEVMECEPYWECHGKTSFIPILCFCERFWIKQKLSQRYGKKCSDEFRCFGNTFFFNLEEVSENSLFS